MKRHRNTLLQRKRVEFEGPGEHRPSSSTRATEFAVVQVKDGYDWLLQITQPATRHAPAP